MNTLVILFNSLFHKGETAMPDEKEIAGTVVHVSPTEVIGAVVEAVQAGKDIVEEVKKADGPADTAVAVITGAAEAVDAGTKLATELVDFEQWLVARGTSIVGLLATIAHQFHGIKL
jgi:hypothetical protein